MYEKERPKRNTKNKAILGKKLAFELRAKLALEFHLRAQKLDRSTPHISDLCRENLA